MVAILLLAMQDVTVPGCLLSGGRIQSSEYWSGLICNYSVADLIITEQIHPWYAEVGLYLCVATMVGALMGWAYAKGKAAGHPS